ncbi:MAG: TRAP transporter large permease subunit [Desulfobacterales bacterium]|nr:TRAP transporter large permease subunit [Desulfobacterales bacterium]
MEAAVIFIVLAILLLVGVPIAICLGLSAGIYLLLFFQIPEWTTATNVFAGILPNKFSATTEHFTLMAIPFFILSSNFLSTGGVARRIVRFANALVGWMAGGLAMAGIMACILFAAVSGSSPATVVAIGSIMIPGMLEAKYSKAFAVGSIATAGSLGILIPPSIVMIVYAVATEQSVGKMFIAGIVPGLMLGGMLLLVTWITAVKKGMPRQKRPTLMELWKSFLGAFWGLLLIVMIIGGIYGGIFTPTEAAAVAAVYSAVIALFVYRDMGFKEVPHVLLESAKMTAMLLFIIACAMIFAHVLTMERIPQNIAGWLVARDMSWWMFLLMVNVILWFAGDFMEPSSIILILAPIFFPIAVALGIDPIHFGIIMTLNMEVGMITPPVGLNLYVASGLSGLSLEEVTKASLPWMAVMIVALIMVTYIPWISLFLVNLLY